MTVKRKGRATLGKVAHLRDISASSHMSLFADFVLAQNEKRTFKYKRNIDVYTKLNIDVCESL